MPHKRLDLLIPKVLVKSEMEVPSNLFSKKGFKDLSKASVNEDIEAWGLPAPRRS